jgi:hypothetical protein
MGDRSVGKNCLLQISNPSNGEGEVMVKTITIDNAVVTQVRVVTDLNGGIHVYCEYVLNSGTTPIQALTQEITSLLSSSEQSTALGVFTSVLQAVSTSQGVTTTGPVPLQPSPTTTAGPTQAPASRVGTPTPRGR